MGCHTWFSVPIITDKVEILQKAQEHLDNSKDIDPETKQMYQYAIDSELQKPVCDLLMCGIDADRAANWTIYQHITDYSFYKYCRENNLDPDKTSKYDGTIRDKLESYSDEPRIGGYPDTIIHSYDEMVAAMETGLPDEDGIIHQFSYQEERKEKFMNGIKTFFERHPQGIITFG